MAWLVVVYTIGACAWAVAYALAAKKPRSSWKTICFLTANEIVLACICYYFDAVIRDMLFNMTSGLDVGFLFKLAVIDAPKGTLLFLFALCVICDSTLLRLQRGRPKCKLGFVFCYGCFVLIALPITLAHPFTTI